jgi:hypothetical protein
MDSPPPSPPPPPIASPVPPPPAATPTPTSAATSVSAAAAAAGAASASATAPTWSWLAVTSLGLGLLPCGLGFPAVICGGVALRRIRRSAGQLKGRGLAVAGVVLGTVWLLLLACALGIPLWMNHRQENDPGPTQQRVTQYQALTERFVASHDGLLPPGNWGDYLELTAEEGAGEEGQGTGDSRFDGNWWRRPLGINAGVMGQRRDAISEPARTVLYFEMLEGGWNRAGGVENFRPPGSGRPVVVGMVDGSVRLIGPDDVAGLKWGP